MKVLLVVAALLLAAVVRGENHPPLLDGGFWQVGPGLSDKMDDAQLAEEVGHMEALGMHLIIIQYTASHYDHDVQTYYAYVPGLNLPYHPGLKGKDPVGAIMDAAEKNGVQVILGGMLMPLPREEHYAENLRVWTSDEANAYRRGVIEKYKEYKCFVGWYTPNEPDPRRLAANECDPQQLIEATKGITHLVRTAKPDLRVVMSIGLYRQTGAESYQLVSREYLEAFWRPFVSQLNDVDTWMIIDGVGTELSTLKHTGMAQAWAADLAHEYGKSFWVDVENAHMGARSYPMTMEELQQSLDVAARHGETLVTFDYAHYMSLNSPTPEAVALHKAYAKYRQQVVAGGEGE